MKKQMVKKLERIRLFLLASMLIVAVYQSKVNSEEENESGLDEQRTVTCKEAAAIHEKEMYVCETVTADREEIKEFEAWVKPQIEGMVPVYGRSIDYISLEDFDLMGRTVFAEAKTESFTGKVAVAEVILNRVESENFPDTVEEVIKKDGAFSSWENGSVAEAPLDDECLEAVQDAVNERALPESVVYFREGRYHDFGIPYMIIGRHYFSSEEIEQK